MSWPALFGFDAYYGTGSGLGVATNASNYALYNYSNSIPPGTTVGAVWFGAGRLDTARDTTYTPAVFAINGLAHIYIGGVDAPHLFIQGASGYPGLNEIDVQHTLHCHARVQCFGVGRERAAGDADQFHHACPSVNGVVCDSTLSHLERTGDR